MLSRQSHSGKTPPSARSAPLGSARLGAPAPRRRRSGCGPARRGLRPPPALLPARPVARAAPGPRALTPVVPQRRRRPRDLGGGVGARGGPRGAGSAPPPPPPPHPRPRTPGPVRLRRGDSRTSPEGRRAAGREELSRHVEAARTSGLAGGGCAGLAGRGSRKPKGPAAEPRAAAVGGTQHPCLFSAGPFSDSEERALEVVYWPVSTLRLSESVEPSAGSPARRDLRSLLYSVVGTSSRQGGELADPKRTSARDTASVHTCVEGIPGTHGGCLTISCGRLTIPSPRVWV